LLPLVARLLPPLLLCSCLLLDLSEVAFSIGSERFLQKWFLYRFWAFFAKVVFSELPFLGFRGFLFWYFQNFLIWKSGRLRPMLAGVLCRSEALGRIFGALGR